MSKKTKRKESRLRQILEIGKRHKKVKLDNTEYVDYNKLNKIADDYKVGIDNIKCGRLRQPIFLEDDSLRGICCLDTTMCKYKFPIDKCPYGKE